MTPPTRWTPPTALASAALFLAAAACEVGGGWCVWRAVHGPPPYARRWALVVPGAVLLVAYGFVAAAQPLVTPNAGEANLFSRTFAVYGGVFIAFSYAWGWAVDRQRPDVGREREKKGRRGGGGGCPRRVHFFST